MPPFHDGRRSGHRLELHLEPFPVPNPFGAVDAQLWAEATSTGAELGGARLPSRAHLLVYACVHFAWSHMLTGGSWRTFRDVVALSEAGVDWSEVSRVAHEWKAASACYWTLRLARSLTGAELAPPVVVETLRPPMPECAAAVLERHFVAQLVPGERSTCPSTSTAEWLWRVAMRPGWSGHARQTRTSGGARWRAAAHHFTAPFERQVNQSLAHWRSYLAGLGSDSRSARDTRG
jgi:hypothetical protein